MADRTDSSISHFQSSIYLALLASWRLLRSRTNGADTEQLMNHIRTACVAVLSAGLFVGCNATNKSPEAKVKPVQPNPQPMKSDVAKRIDLVKQEANTLAQQAGDLPGRTADQDRQMVQNVFATLETLLPNLAGPDQNGAFRQQVQIVRTTREQLGNASSTMPLEPVIDTGLRAAYRALEGLHDQQFTDSPDMAQKLDQLGSHLNELDGAQGAMHSQVVAESVRMISDIVQNMTNVLEQRLNGPPAPRTAKG